MASDNVVAKISADITELKATLVKGLGEFKGFGEKVTKTVPEDPFKKLTSGIKDLGQIVGAAAPFVIAGQQAAQFEADLRSLNTITDLSDAALTRYGDRLRTVSVELGTAQGASQSAQAAFAVAGSGFEDAAEAATVLETTLKAATAGAMKDAAPVAETLSGALKAFGAEAGDSERFANVLFTTVKDGITTFPELTATLGNVAPIAASAGISFEELGAAIAVTTGKGIRTSTAVDGLKGAITNLLAPSEQARKELERLGVTVTENSLKQKGLKNTLLEIAKANGGSAQSFKMILGDVQAFNAALALTSDGGAAFEKALQNAQNSAGALDSALAERNKTFQASMDQFKVALEAAGIAVGTVFLPVAKQLLDGVSGIVAAFATAPAPIRDVITVVGTLGAASLITSKAIALLTTVAQRETLAMAASSAAKLLTADASVVLTAATIKTQIAFNAAIARATAMSFSMAGLSGAMATASTATLGLTASLGPLLLAGGGLIYLAGKLADEWTKSAQSLDDYATAAAKASGNVDDAFKSAAMSAEQLFKAGKSSEQLEGELAGLREAGESVYESFLRGNLSAEQKDKQLKKIADTVMTLRKRTAELASMEKVRDSATGPESSNDAEKRLEREKEASKDAEKARKEALAVDLHAVELKKKAGELSAREEIRQLEEVKKAHQLTADEVRDIEGKQAEAQGRILKNNEEQWKKAAEAQKKAAEDGKKAAEDNFDLRTRALETERDATKTVEARVAKEKELVDLEAQKALFSEKNKTNRAAILENAKAEKALLDSQAKDEIAKRDAELAVQRKALAKDVATEEEAAAQDGFDKRRRLLDEEEARGKNVRGERLLLEREELEAAEATNKRRLEMVKEEAAAKRKAADVEASPEQKVINADTEALEVRRAEREAAKQTSDIFDRANANLVERTAHLREQLELLKKQKEEAKGPSFSGEAYGLESINENRSGLGISAKKARLVNEEGMTAKEIEAEISRNEGMLGNRKGAFQRTGSATGSTFGVSKGDLARAEAEAAAKPKSYESAVTQIVDLLSRIADRIGRPAAGQDGKRQLSSMGVPHSLTPNIGF